MNDWREQSGSIAALQASEAHTADELDARDDEPRCDLCGDPPECCERHTFDDWNGETGCHYTCEARDREGRPAIAGHAA